MTAQNVRELLKHEVELLADDLAEEVLDFVLFVRARRKEEEFLWQQVEETRAYRQQHSQEVVTVTAEEWERATSQFTDDLP
jgi:hypothetical protein